MELEGRPLGTTGVTALALLPFLGAGYTPLSKDVYVIDGGDWCFGAEIRKGLTWLIRDQRDDGTFRSIGEGALDPALAAFALSEAYGLTADASLRVPAERAVDALLRMQGPDGRWDGPGPTAWAILALRSARDSELLVDPAALNRALLAAGDSGGPGRALARILLRKEGIQEAHALLEEGRTGTAQSPTWWYFSSLALWAQDGHPERPWGSRPGPEWRAWSRILHEKLVPLIREDGSVEGSSRADAVVRTSLMQMTLGIYYLYSCSYRPQ